MSLKNSLFVSVLLLSLMVLQTNCNDGPPKNEGNENHENSDEVSTSNPTMQSITTAVFQYAINNIGSDLENTDCSDCDISVVSSQKLTDYVDLASLQADEYTNELLVKILEEHEKRIFVLENIQSNGENLNIAYVPIPEIFQEELNNGVGFILTDRIFPCKFAWLGSMDSGCPGCLGASCCGNLCTCIHCKLKPPFVDYEKLLKDIRLPDKPKFKKQLKKSINDVALRR